ncbi:MAG: DUF2269 family protein [Pseudolysinimonas sp.]
MALILQVLHVVGAVFVIGPMVVVPMLGLRAIRTGDGLQIRGLARSAVGFGIGSIVVTAIGFGLMATQDEEPLTMATPWILWSLILFVIAIAIHFIVVVPLLLRAATRTGEPPSSSGYGPVAAASGIVSLLLLAIVILMVAQPS